MNLRIRDLDNRDRAILTELQRDGRLSNAELAVRVGLSESACLRRVKRLEAEKVIAGYRMLVNPAAVERAGTVFVEVTLDRQQEEGLAAFEKAVKQVPEVMECYLMAGDLDYLLRVVIADPADYERIHMERLTRLPGVARIKSIFALRTVEKKTAMPL